MARIDNFIYCLNAMSDSNNGTNAIGIMSVITPDYIPGTYSFSILFNLMDISDGEHLVEIKFNTPDNECLIDLKSNISYTQNTELKIPREYEGIYICSDWKNIVFKTSGMYYTEVYLDNIKIDTFNIYVQGKNEV